MKINLEVTDTFGGEANYSWVNRATYEYDEHEALSRLGIVRMAKKFAGLTGQDCLVEYTNDQVTITPTGRSAPCIICFVNIEY
jgi:hypothetical protein